MKAAIIFIALAVAGCKPNPENAPSAGGDLIVYTDSETGCQYIQQRQDRAITPRMGRDGKQICKQPKGGA